MVNVRCYLIFYDSLIINTSTIKTVQWVYIELWWRDNKTYVRTYVCVSVCGFIKDNNGLLRERVLQNFKNYVKDFIIIILSCFCITPIIYLTMVHLLIVLINLLYRRLNPLNTISLKESWNPSTSTLFFEWQRQ